MENKSKVIWTIFVALIVAGGVTASGSFYSSNEPKALVGVECIADKQNLIFADGSSQLARNSADETIPCLGGQATIAVRNGGVMSTLED